jgi:phosphatidylinositol alpha-1,6-mannosyltransferase
MTQKKILCITNDFGPRAGGIETFVIGLIERFPKNSVIVYTSSQTGDKAWDSHWLEKYGVKVIRDRSKVLLPTFRVGRSVRKIAQSEKLASGLRREGVKKIVALTHGHEVWWAKVFPFSVALQRIGKSVDHLTYLGDYTKNQISKALKPKSISALVRIAPGIDIDHFKPFNDSKELRQNLGIDEKKVTRASKRPRSLDTSSSYNCIKVSRCASSIGWGRSPQKLLGKNCLKIASLKPGNFCWQSAI